MTQTAPAYLRDQPLVFAMNSNWERRHPCRRVAAMVRKLAGKDAGAPSMLGSH